MQTHTQTNREDLLDAAFHKFTHYLENIILKCGTFNCYTRLEQLGETELDCILWEIEEEFDTKLSYKEKEECFNDAFNYLDDLYAISALESI